MPVHLGPEVGPMCIPLSLDLSQEFLVCTLDPSLMLRRVVFVLSNMFNDFLLSKLTWQAMLHHVLVILDPLGCCLPLGLLCVGVLLWQSFDLFGASLMLIFIS